MKVVVLGATGTVGARAAIELFRSGEIERLTVTGRRRDEAAAFASRFSKSAGPTVVADELDVTDPRLAEHLAGQDVVVNCTGPAYELEETVVRAAVDAGVDYVSLCDDYVAADALLVLDDRARERDVTAIVGCGFSPGISNLLAAAAARELDDVAEVQIAVAASSADSDGYASARHLIFSMAQPAPFLSDGTLTTERAGTIPRRVYFPEPVGWVETFVCGHPEVTTLPRSFPNVSTVQFRLGLTERVVMDLIRASRTTGLLRTEGLRKAWLSATWPTRSIVERVPPRGAAWTGVRIDVHGTTDGTASIVSLAVVDHLVNLASLTIKEAALALGRGEAKEKGIRGPDEVFDPATMLERLSQRGIRAARLESEPV